jgi:hypothetical protein
MRCCCRLHGRRNAQAPRRDCGSPNRDAAAGCAHGSLFGHPPRRCRRLDAGHRGLAVPSVAACRAVGCSGALAHCTSLRDKKRAGPASSKHVRSAAAAAAATAATAATAGRSSRCRRLVPLQQVTPGQWPARRVDVAVRPSGLCHVSLCRRGAEVGIPVRANGKAARVRLAQRRRREGCLGAVEGSVLRLEIVGGGVNLQGMQAWLVLQAGQLQHRCEQAST